MNPKLDMIGIVSKDIKESLRFYRLLGLEVADPEDGEPYVECTLPNGLRISWNDVEMMKGVLNEWHEPVGHRMGLAFLCDSPESVNAKHAELVGAGFTSYKQPWDAFWGQRYAVLQDPDGNLVDLFAPLPQT